MNRRTCLLRGGKLFAAFGLLAILGVLLDYAIDFRPPGIQSSYRFTLEPLPFDRAQFLRQDNLSILVIRRSKTLIAALQSETGNLQDADSQSSRQPDFARNRLRSASAEYFVAYSIGSDRGCPLRVGGELSLKESCGPARYDFAGRGFKGENRFQNLRIPDYNFNPDFTVLTIKP